MKNHLTTLLILSVAIAAIIGSLGGCSRQTGSDPLPPSQAQEQFVQMLKEENGLAVTVNEFENTFWIYLPLEDNIFQMKANPKGISSSKTPSVKPTVKFLDGIYQDQQFILKYDIVPSKGYAKDYGYTSEFSEEYRTKQRHILTAIYRIYSEIDNPPLFFVIVIADIKNGLESKTFIHFNDLKRAYTDQSFHEEYARRVISEQPTGNIKLIDDTTGEHVDYHDLTWPQFLMKQMIFRITFKYQRSAFPPSDDTRSELLNIAADTVHAYDFTDFTSLVLHDLAQETTFSFAQEDLAAYRTEPSQGRLIHIKFQ